MRQHGVAKGRAVQPRAVEQRRFEQRVVELQAAEIKVAQVGAAQVQAGQGLLGLQALFDPVLLALAMALLGPRRRRHQVRTQPVALHRLAFDGLAVGCLSSLGRFHQLAQFGHLRRERHRGWGCFSRQPRRSQRRLACRHALCRIGLQRLALFARLGDAPVAFDLQVGKELRQPGHVLGHHAFCGLDHAGAIGMSGGFQLLVQRLQVALAPRRGARAEAVRRLGHAVERDLRLEGQTLGQQLGFAQHGQATGVAVFALGKDRHVVRHGARCIDAISTDQQVADVAELGVARLRLTLPDQHHALTGRKEQHAAQQRGQRLKRAGAFALDEGLRRDAGQLALQQRLGRVQTVQLIRLITAQGFIELLVFGGQLVVAAIEVGRRAGEPGFEPLLVGRTLVARAAWVVDGNRREAHAAVAVGLRLPGAGGVFEMWQRERWSQAIDSRVALQPGIETAPCRVVRKARAAIGP